MYAAQTVPQIGLKSIVTLVQSTDPETIQPGQGNEEYRVIGGDDKAFPTEYSVSGWYKWVGPYTADWHLVFRLTMNNKPDNTDASKHGDRDLTIFANRNLNYYPCTYSYANMNAGGNTNIYQAINHAGIN